MWLGGRKFGETIVCSESWLLKGISLRGVCRMGGKGSLDTADCVGRHVELDVARPVGCEHMDRRWPWSTAWIELVVQPELAGQYRDTRPLKGTSLHGVCNLGGTGERPQQIALDVMLHKVLPDPWHLKIWIAVGPGARRGSNWCHNRVF